MEKIGTFSLFETRVNGKVTYAYIMVFHYTSVLVICSTKFDSMSLCVSFQMA